MTKRFCDKCGKEIPKDSTYVQIFADQNIDGKQTRLGKADFCVECFSRFGTDLKEEEKKDG